MKVFRARMLVLACLPMFALGCGGGDVVPTANATVEVTIDGKPAGDLTVILAPSKRGRPVAIEIGADGKGKGDVVVGDNQVTVVPAPGAASGHGAPGTKSPIHAVFSGSSSPLTAKVVASGANAFKFEVGTEAGKTAAKTAAGGGHGGHGS